METKNTYLREMHSLLEGCAFIWLVLCGFIPTLIKFSAVHVAPESAVVLYQGGLMLFFLILYVLIAMFSQIQSLAIECAIAAWIFYIAVISEIGVGIFIGHTGAALIIGIFAATALFTLFGSLYIALRRDKKYDDESVYHTVGYKTYRFVRGAAFVFALFSLINLFNDEFAFPVLIERTEHMHEMSLTGGKLNWLIKEQVESFAYFLKRAALIVGTEGMILLIAGFLISVFAIGIELIIVAWCLLASVGGVWWLLRVVIPSFVQYKVATVAELAAKELWHVFLYELVWVILSLLILWLLIHFYIKRTNARLHS